MRAAVFSDTHGRTDLMVDAIEHYKPDMIIHLGDCEKDTEILKKKFPDIPLHNVCGNCDFSPKAPLAELVDMGPVKALICHGHSYGVDMDTDRLVWSAREQGAKIAMYGHTHRADNTTAGGVQVLNPGTAGSGYRLSWATVEVLENGGIATAIQWFDK